MFAAHTGLNSGIAHLVAGQLEPALGCLRVSGKVQLKADLAIYVVLTIAECATRIA